MKLFQHSSGTVFSFGFDMVKRAPSTRMICWSDPATGEWEIKTTNQAGFILLSHSIDPEFVRECNGTVIAYQPSKCLELQYIGPPYVWSVHTLQPDQMASIAA